MLDSRPDKVHGIDAAELHAHWRAEARAAGFDPARLVTQEIRASIQRRDHSDDEMIALALSRASEETAAWLRADVARHLSTLLAPGLTGSAVELVAEVERLADITEQRCVALGPERGSAVRRRADGRPVSEAVTDRRLTTPALLIQEQALQTWATALRGRSRSRTIHSSTQHGRSPGDRLVLVVGPAGTGKTHTTARAVAALHTQGRPVVGLAPSGKAADVLAAAAGCETDTLAGFVTRHRNALAVARWHDGDTR
ncbi:MAG: AAA family ATPase [Microthrixaceae bacterium]